MKDDSSEGVNDGYEAIISHNLGSKKSETSAADPVVMMKYWPTTLKNTLFGKLIKVIDEREKMLGGNSV